MEDMKILYRKYTIPKPGMVDILSGGPPCKDLR